MSRRTPEDEIPVGRDEDEALLETAVVARPDGEGDDPGDERARESTEPADRAESIVRSHMRMAILAGAVPIPLFDLTAITAVQLDMLKRLAAARGVAFDPRSSRAFVTSLSGALAGGAVARTAASLIKLVPGVGTVTGVLTQAVVSGASTYAVGRVFDRLFAEGRPLDSLALADVREEARASFAKGVELARGEAEGRRALELLDAIERVHALSDGESPLRERGIERRKARLVARLREALEAGVADPAELRRRLEELETDGALSGPVVSELVAVVEGQPAAEKPAEDRRGDAE